MRSLRVRDTSGRLRGRRRRVSLAIALVAIVVLVAATLATRRIAHVVRRDLRADIAWSRVDGPVADVTRADRWYPVTYPVLERWTFGDDLDRATYAQNAIVRHGGPLARFWMERAIDRDAPATLIQLPARTSPLSGATMPDYASFVTATGLDTPSARTRAAERALAHLHVSSNDGISFDEALIPWLGVDAVPAIVAWTANGDPVRLRELGELLSYDLRDDPRVARLQALSAAADARALAENERAHPTVESTRAPRDAATYDAVIALNDGDTKGLPFLRTIVDGDLRRLNVVPSSDLIAVANAFPNSRFTRGCLAYDALRGGTYFGRDDGDDERLPVASAARWRAWLAAYPDHPGADDATYWLGHALQAEGRNAEATWTYARAVEDRPGDGDMAWQLTRRLLFMLDVGASDDDLATLERAHADDPMIALVRYATAVRLARAERFDDALALERSANLPRALAVPHVQTEFYYVPTVIRAIEDQQRRWERLASISTTPNGTAFERRDRLASAWNDDDGWRIGYLELFEGARDGGAMFEDDPLFQTPAIAARARAANQNVQTIELAQPLTAPGLPGELRRRNAERVIVALYRQQAAFPDDETSLMGAFAALPPPRDGDTTLHWKPIDVDASFPGAARYLRQERVDRAAQEWWARQSIAAAQRYVVDFPHDAFGSTALLAAYEVSGKTSLLRQLIAHTPNGPRNDEAKALLWRDSRSD